MPIFSLWEYSPLVPWGVLSIDLDAFEPRHFLCNKLSVATHWDGLARLAAIEFVSFILQAILQVIDFLPATPPPWWYPLGGTSHWWDVLRSHHMWLQQIIFALKQGERFLRSSTSAYTTCCLLQLPVVRSSSGRLLRGAHIALPVGLISLMARGVRDSVESSPAPDVLQPSSDYHGEVEVRLLRQGVQFLHMVRSLLGERIWAMRHVEFTMDDQWWQAVPGQEFPLRIRVHFFAQRRGYVHDPVNYQGGTEMVNMFWSIFRAHKRASDAAVEDSVNVLLPSRSFREHLQQRQHNICRAFADFAPPEDEMELPSLLVRIRTMEGRDPDEDTMTEISISSNSVDSDGQ